MSTPTRYRAEVIGSMLRPAELKQAQADLGRGELDPAEFKAVEDAAVNEAVAIQERAGVDVVTDGEMRRWLFTGPLTEAVSGIEPLSSEHAPVMHWHGGEGLGDLEYTAPHGIVAPLKRVRSLTTEEYAYLRARATRPVKMTLPSPLMLSSFWWKGISDRVYSDAFEAFRDGAEIVRQEIAELASLGCEYIQIDAPELATHVLNPDQRADWLARDVDPDRLLDEGVGLINGLADHPGVRFTLHICRGNFAGRWLAEGGYEAVSRKIFPRAGNFDAFALEYDGPRAGSFDALAHVPDDKLVILGLVSTKTDELEEKEELLARIQEAARFVPRDRLALSTQCGFASSVPGNPIAWETQERKLRLVAEVASEAWS
ncbi:MAG TPA: cobalamin-independent methionine synthase II family protein [Solirubrobacteraceae bacterium]|nr:cobalamin-independent methionine synthase II family protein [Solirubrobacteraceae bacterium]